MNDSEGHITYTFKGVATAQGFDTLEIVAEKVIATTDPLTGDYFDVWRTQHAKGEHNFGCTCGGENRPEMQHLETCGVTPLFASVCRDHGLYSAIVWPIVQVFRRQTTRRRTEEECAECIGDCPDGVCPDGENIYPEPTYDNQVW